MSTSQPTMRESHRPRALACAIVLGLASIGLAPFGAAGPAAALAVDHLVISEVVTGGGSASDELIELYNPSGAVLPLEGLELVYVSASGVTISLRAAWSLGAPGVPPGAHVLVANELGVYAAIADAVYSSGMAASGGSVALRIQGAGSAIDAVGWGTATSSWLEGSPAPPPPVGASLERRPGGVAGSGVDTDDNVADFTVRPVPDPQNAASAPVPSATAAPSPVATPTPTAPAPPPSAGPTPTGSPGAAPLDIAAARALTDGSATTIEGTALTGSDFSDGGGYVADETGGIAVLLESGAFARGDLVRVSGIVDDRFAQRTLRATGVEKAAPGGAALAPLARATGAIDESAEGRLVRVQGAIDGSPTALTGAVAFDVDDGSGGVRVVVGTATGIETMAWSDGRGIVVTGVAGQRDSSGTGASGYRVQPRDPADVELLPASSPAPSGSPSPGPTTPVPSPSSGTPPAEVSTIAHARAAAVGARLRVRGVVTLASGTVEAGSAVIQDATGAILLRLGEEVADLQLGRLVEVDGVRSTKSGMDSLRVSEPPVDLGTTGAPIARQVRSGEAGEAHEAQLIVVRGALVASARRASTGSVSFDLDDGSGPLRVALGAPLSADDAALERGAWVEVAGVLGQQTTGAEPLAGYRVWPGRADDVRVLAPATDVDAGGGDATDGGNPTAAGTATAALDALGTMPLGDLRIGATLVAGEWEEAGLGGLLWDGRSLVGIAAASSDLVGQAVGDRPPPIPLELGRLHAVATDPRLGIPVVALGSDVGDVVVGAAPPAPPLARVPGADEGTAWVTLVGRLSGDLLNVAGARVGVERLCGDDRGPRRGAVSVTGVALANPTRLVVPCEGVRAVPRLALPTATTRETAGTAVHPSSTGAETGEPGPGSRDAAAGALLAIGVVLLLLVALMRWRLGPANAAADASGTDADMEPRDGEPRLTLVSVPREHG